MYLCSVPRLKWSLIFEKNNFTPKKKKRKKKEIIRRWNIVSIETRVIDRMVRLENWIPLLFSKRVECNWRKFVNDVRSCIVGSWMREKDEMDKRFNDDCKGIDGVFSKMTRWKGEREGGKKITRLSLCISYLTTLSFLLSPIPSIPCVVRTFFVNIVTNRRDKAQKDETKMNDRRRGCERRPRPILIIINALFMTMRRRWFFVFVAHYTRTRTYESYRRGEAERNITGGREKKEGKNIEWKNPVLRTGLHCVSFDLSG